MNEDIKWNKDRHEENLAKQQQEIDLKKQEIDLVNIKNVYDAWKRSSTKKVMRAKTLQEIQDQFNILTNKLNAAAHGKPHLKDWLDATLDMINDAKRRASTGAFNVSGKNTRPGRRIKKRIRSANRRRSR